MLISHNKQTHHNTEETEREREKADSYISTRTGSRNVDAMFSRYVSEKCKVVMLGINTPSMFKRKKAW